MVCTVSVETLGEPGSRTAMPFSGLTLRGKTQLLRRISARAGFPTFSNVVFKVERQQQRVGEEHAGARLFSLENVLVDFRFDYYTQIMRSCRH